MPGYKIRWGITNIRETFRLLNLFIRYALKKSSSAKTERVMPKSQRASKNKKATGKNSQRKIHRSKSLISRKTSGKSKKKMERFGMPKNLCKDTESSTSR